jgi:hypothetical protein
MQDSVLETSIFIDYMNQISRQFFGILSPNLALKLIELFMVIW